MAKASQVTPIRLDLAAERAPVKPAPSQPFLSTTRIGRLVDWTEEGLLVDYKGSGGKPVVAESLVAWEPKQIREAIESRRSLLLAYQESDETGAGTPVIVGALQDVPEIPGPDTEERAAQQPRETVQARIDGKRIEFRAEDEVVLSCGKASITLRRNGRILIRGAYVETRAKGTNRIKGGNVLIN